MKKILLLLGSLFLLVCWSQADEDSFVNSVYHDFWTLLQRRPQEKVYLHTDRDHYEAGDRIWFRAYLLDASTHRPSDMSGFVYVELWNNLQDSMLVRVKLAPADSVFSGYLQTEEYMPQGDYTLRAYSYWMQNGGDDFIFRKRIRLMNPRSTKVLTEMKYVCEDNGGAARLRFYNTRGDSFGKMEVEYEMDGRKRFSVTDQDGCIRLKLDPEDYGKKFLVHFSDDEALPFEQYLFLPDPDSSFTVSFMPEGGNLLEGCKQTVAFKVIGRDGLSREVKGFVYDSEGRQIVVANTMHKGMGAFVLDVVPGERYHVEFLGAGGKTERFDLPEACPEGMALKVLNRQDMVGYRVLSANGGEIPSSLYLVAHVRGIPLACIPVGKTGGGKIPVGSLPEGILHLTLMDRSGKIYSERLCFIRRPECAALEIGTDREHYCAREQIAMQIQVVADSMVADKGSFSVSVTDDSRVERDTLQDNILSGMLLTSELKGYVEDPAWYFKDDKIATRIMLDVLMMTQGWSRFHTEKRKSDTGREMNYYLERGQTIAGQVKNFWGKDAGMANLILLSSNGIFRDVKADSLGHFMIDGIAFPDSTYFLLQGKSRKGRRSVEVVLEEENFLPATVKIPFAVQDVGREGFYTRNSKDYYYDNGLKVYVLDEAVVKRKKTDGDVSIYDRIADYSLDSSRLASMRGWEFRRILQEIPGLEVWKDTIKRYGKPVYVRVNDLEETYDFVFTLQGKDIQSINFIAPPTAFGFFGVPATDGALLITTSPDFYRSDYKSMNILNFSLLGYQKKAEFYQPRYEVDSVRMALQTTADWRSTLYWNPDLKTDGKGRMACSFSSSDSYGPYTVVVEGVLEDGTLCRKEKKIRLKF